MSKREEIETVIFNAIPNFLSPSDKWLKPSDRLAIVECVRSALQNAGYLVDFQDREVPQQQDPENPNSWFHELCGQWHDNGPLQKCKKPTTKETMETNFDYNYLIEIIDVIACRVPNEISGEPLVNSLGRSEAWKMIKKALLTVKPAQPQPSALEELEGYILSLRQTSSTEQDVVIDEILGKIKSMKDKK